MPVTINGIGTAYYFKRNVITREGTCDHCQRHAVLSDYDVGHFFVVLYIPLIPMGRQMILGECSSCSMHRAMPLRQWEQLREQSINSAMDQLGADPNNADAAMELLGTYTLFNQLEDAWNLASAMQTTHADNYEVMLSLGAWYESRNHPEPANACFARVVALDPDRPASKRIRMIDAMDANKFGEVKLLANDLVELNDSDHVGVIFRAAQFFTEHQKFEDAFGLYEKLLAQNPELKKEKDVRRAVRIAEQGVGRPASLVPPKKLGMLD